MILQKMNEIEIPECDPWRHDKLDRGPAAEVLTALIRTITQPFVISMSAPWGMGKTTFIKMWSQQLIKEKHPCIYFNAWENDFTDSPLVSFMGEMNQYIQKHFQGRTEITSRFDAVREKAGQLTRQLAPVAVRMLTRGAIESLDELSETISIDKAATGETAKELSRFLINEIKGYADKKDAILSFKESLAQFAKRLTEDDDTRGPLVVFIDELDRCRPDYALEFLENIKHIFGVDNIIFILAIAKSQLRSSVEARYGNRIESDGYLRRFIDLEYELERPDYRSYGDLLFDEFDVSTLMNQRPGTEATLRDIKGIFRLLSSSFELSPRDQAQCFTLLNVILRTKPVEDLFYPLLVFLILLRFKAESQYRSVVERQITKSKAMDIVRDLEWSEYPALQGFLEYMLSCHLLNNSEYGQYMSNVSSSAKSDVVNSAEERSKYVLKLSGLYDREYVRGTVFPRLTDRIELTRNLKS